MTRLLVSVRSVQECDVAVCAGADVIDVKEPNRGALGAADPETIRQIADHVPPSIALSVALGELVERDQLRAEMIEVLGRARFVKVGLAECADLADWPARWRRLLAQLPPGISPIAVAYADWPVARAPHPHDVLREALATGCSGLLVDTFGKHAGNLFDHMPIHDATRLVEVAHGRGLTVALAGSLNAMHVHTVARLQADLFAVRGAVCRGGRDGVVDAVEVRRLAALVAGERARSLARS